MLILAGAGLAAALWPPTYSSTGTILIEQQELPTDLVRSTVSTYAAQRIQIITQRVMTTENLLGIIERYNLYPEMRKRRPREEVIAAMRQDASLQMISADVIDPRDGHPTKATIAFSLTFRNRSPQIASQVANELVSLYLQQNIESREKSSRDAAVFLADQSKQISNNIDSLQARLAIFKVRHADELPDLTQLNITSMNRAEDEMRDTDTQLQAIDQQLLYLNAQLAQVNPIAQIYTSTGERVQSPADLLKSLRSDYDRESALYSPDYPDVVRLKREIAGLEADTKPQTKKSAIDDTRRQLEDMQTQLAAAKQRYAPDHPDVIRLQRQVGALQKQLESMPAPTSGSGATSEAEAAAAADNPVYIQLRTQREALIDQQSALRARRASLETERDQYERRLALAPGVERDYDEIIRGLGSAQAQYAQIRGKQEEADIAENLETENKGEHFTLIEPPLTPEEPTSPNRPLILALGVVLAFVASMGSVALLESADGSIRGRQDLQRLLAVAPLAVIPTMVTKADRALLRRRQRYASFGAIGALALMLLAVQLFYRPLDVLWVVALRHFGVQG